MNRFKFNKERHHYSLDDKPLIGCTTALSVLDKPGLTWWASSLACQQLGWINPKDNPPDECIKSAETIHSNIKNMTTAEYVRLLNSAYKAHNERKKSSASKGTDLHALCELYIKGRIAGVKGQEMPIPLEIEAFHKWSETNVKQFLFSEMFCYSQIMWTGGCADFAYIDNSDRVVLGDFKSSKSVYFSQFAQCGGYQSMLEENGGFNESGDLIFELPRPIDYHAIFSFSVGLDKPFFSRDTEKVKRAFSYCVELYRTKMFFEKEYKNE